MVTALRLERVIKELTQTELSRRTGIPQWRISLVERGKRPTQEEAAALGAVFGVDPSALWPGLESQP